MFIGDGKLCSYLSLVGNPILPLNRLRYCSKEEGGSLGRDGH